MRITKSVEKTPGDAQQTELIRKIPKFSIAIKGL